jgi:hypothetical protein
VDNQCNTQNGRLKLNVLFHGAFAFDQTTQPGRILALIPYMDYHVYRAGSWLAETELRGRTGSKAVIYELLGVIPGCDKFDPNQNLIVNPQQPGNPQSFPYATLVFPLPQKITSLLRADIPRSAFTFPQELAASGDQHISTVQVFTYDFPDENAVMLRADDGDGHYWQPVLVDDHINLHIFAAEDHYHKPPNAEEDFNWCAELIGGLNLRLQTRSLRTSGLLAIPSLPHGVDPRETESLALRTERMARLGRLVLQGAGDASAAWYGNDALDGDPQACAGPEF